MKKQSPLGRTVQSLLRGMGKTYLLDPSIPDALLARELSGRMFQLLRGLARLRAVVFVGRGVVIRGKSQLQVARGVTLGGHARLDAHGRRGLTLGPRTKLGQYSVVTTTSHLGRYGEGLSVGSDTGIGDYAHLGCSGGVVIGSDVIAGPYLTVHSQEHEYGNPRVPIRTQGTKEHEVIVGDDVWIGARVTILAGSHVGNGSVIAAGSVVKGDFPPYSLIAGVPARRLRGIRGHD